MLSSGLFFNKVSTGISTVLKTSKKKFKPLNLAVKLNLPAVFPLFFPFFNLPAVYLFSFPKKGTFGAPTRTIVTGPSTGMRRPSIGAATARSMLEPPRRMCRCLRCTEQLERVRSRLHHCDHHVVRPFSKNQNKGKDSRCVHTTKWVLA